MPPSSGKTESISAIPDKELFSYGQIDFSPFRRALSKEPTYKTYRTLLVHRRTLECLINKMDSIFEEAHDAQRKASDNYNKTAEALANACDATMSPYSTTSPPIVGKALQTILELQMFYHDERMGVVIERGVERGQVKGFLRAVNEKVEEVEQVLVKKYGIHTVDDEGNPLEMQDLERVIDVMASVPGIENI